jgi:hypothetical protein
MMVSCSTRHHRTTVGSHTQQNLGSFRQIASRTLGETLRHVGSNQRGDATARLGSGLAMEQYRHRLEHTQIKICVGGLLTLPWIGQVIWIAIIMAIYIRLIFVIARTIRRSAWYDSCQRRVGISDSDGTWVLGVDAKPRNCIENKPTLPQNAALTGHKRASVPRQNRRDKLICGRNLSLKINRKFLCTGT